MHVRPPDNPKRLQPVLADVCRILRRPLTYALVVALLVTGSPAFFAVYGQDQKVDARREYNVKAVSIYGFCRFVTWPHKTFTGVNSDLVIGIAGDSLISEPLQAIATKKTVMRRRLRVVQCNDAEDVLECHVTFVSKSLPITEQDKIIRLSRGKPVMLVGERSGFAETGGVANFFIRGGRVQFELNHQEARRRGLQLDAKLLSLGTQIR